MKIRQILLITAICVTVNVYGQTPLNKTIPVQSGQQIMMRFDYPKLVKVSTWEKNEILIQGIVAINEGENDDAFILENDVTGNTIDVRSFIRDLKNLPQRVTVMIDGKKTIFRNKEEWKKFQQEHGSNYRSISFGPDIDITLEIKVPQNVQTHIESVYGIVEITNYTGPLTVVSTYGGVDAALQERAVGEIVAETNYGEIFTNFDSKFGGDNYRDEAFHTLVTARPGSGPKYSFESKYGNVYIRKKVN